ncbi:hypothetical protein VP01_616g3 [Puccinia sorghi]|uniref:Uncharacterized protein n=1 Tax=Puccinia sorghi TaxID=27349 RepID=A0A0L6UIX3_9BASI|nr:hypothetical protein VP01_616g3 [Puccinia sorghi]
MYMNKEGYCYTMWRRATDFLLLPTKASARVFLLLGALGLTLLEPLETHAHDRRLHDPPLNNQGAFLFLPERPSSLNQGDIRKRHEPIALFSQSQDLIPPSLHTLCPPKGPVNRARQLRQKSFEHQVLLFFISSTRGTLTMKRVHIQHHQDSFLNNTASQSAGNRADADRISYTGQRDLHGGGTAHSLIVCSPLICQGAAYIENLLPRSVNSILECFDTQKTLQKLSPRPGRGIVIIAYTFIFSKIHTAELVRQLKELLEYNLNRGNDPPERKWSKANNSVEECQDVICQHDRHRVSVCLREACHWYILITGRKLLQVHPEGEILITFIKHFQHSFWCLPAQLVVETNYHPGIRFLGIYCIQDFAYRNRVLGSDDSTSRLGALTQAMPPSSCFNPRNLDHEFRTWIKLGGLINEQIYFLIIDCFLIVDLLYLILSNCGFVIFDTPYYLSFFLKKKCEESVSSIRLCYSRLCSSEHRLVGCDNTCYLWKRKSSSKIIIGKQGLRDAYHRTAEQLITGLKTEDK